MLQGMLQLFSTGGPRIVILILNNKDNITEIAQSTSKRGHKPLFSLKMGHTREKVEKLRHNQLVYANHYKGSQSNKG